MLTLARTEPMERITVKQIVEQSGLSLQTFYNHFRDREDLIVWMHQDGCARAMQNILDGKCSFHELMLYCVRFQAENARYMCGVRRYAMLSAATVYDFFVGLLRRLMHTEELPEELRACVRMYTHACLGTMTEWADDGCPIPAERLAEYLEQGMPQALKPYLLD